MYIHTYVYTYIHIHICIYVYVYTYMHAYIQTNRHIDLSLKAEGDQENGLGVEHQTVHRHSLAASPCGRKQSCK
jgi:hypothetical protein